jgi:hypothetical protein
MPPRHSIALAALLLAAPSTTVLAQAETEGDAAPAAEIPAGPPSDAVRLSLDISGAYQFDTDIDDGGEFSVIRAGVAPGLSFQLSERHTLALRLGYAYDGYDFSGRTGFGGLDPWSSVHTLSFAAQLRWRVDDEWTVFGGPLLRVSGESDADVDDAFAGGGLAGFTYKFSDTLTLGPGVIVISEIEDGTDVFPILFVNWQLSDRLALRTRGGEGAVRGGGVELAWRLDDAWEAGVAASFGRRRFRLDDDGPAPDGVGQDRSFALLGALRWEPSRDVRLALTAGVTLDGELRLENERGDRLAGEDYHPAPFVGVSMTLRF